MSHLSATVELAPYDVFVSDYDYGLMYVVVLTVSALGEVLCFLMTEASSRVKGFLVLPKVIAKIADQKSPIN